MDAVVLHDGTVHPGGAVDVVLEAARVLDADLVVGFSGPEPEWWAKRAPNDVEVLTRRKRSWFVKDLQTAWKMLRIDLSSYDVVLSSGPATKFYQPVDGQRVYHYMHHPPLRVLWYDGGLVTYGMRKLDWLETMSIPTIITNSELTAERLAVVYGREADAVINPPVDVERFDPSQPYEPNAVVMVGRLEERKRTRLALEAFTGFEGPTAERPHLHVVGDGPLKADLQRDAPENVTFHGYVDDGEVVRHVERAEVGLFLARREDFGITTIEYMAAGRPVVGVDEPNTNNQVRDGETGVLVAPDADEIREGVRRALEGDWDRHAIRDEAEQYTPDRFNESIRRAVQD